ncbi:MAG: hypothetical protein ACI4LH_05260, partial [Candidatus Heritagella sp.]
MDYPPAEIFFCIFKKAIMVLHPFLGKEKNGSSCGIYSVHWMFLQRKNHRCIMKILNKNEISVWGSPFLMNQTGFFEKKVPVSEFSVLSFSTAQNIGFSSGFFCLNESGLCS